MKSLDMITFQIRKWIVFLSFCFVLAPMSGCSPEEHQTNLTCGNGKVDSGEICDGNCVYDCNDGNACTQDNMTGSASDCSAACSHQMINQCQSGDGCCPAGCNHNNDSDCSASCGNGLLDPGEMCDGNCPTSCNDGNACTQDFMTGSAQNCSALCLHQPINQCINGDGCCPAGCNHNNDSDCSATCGNGMLEPGETCDSNCPTGCNDGNACTIDSMTGSAQNCSASCSHQVVTQCAGGDGCCPSGCNHNIDGDCSASCGNDVVEPGETCDGNCPTSCNDGNTCTIDSMTGSAQNCSASCIHQVVTQCAGGDGCCPNGCNHNIDSDCSTSCGNDVVEPGETCDGNCPTTCDDNNPCTRDLMTGSIENCSITCSHEPINQCASGDSCCPAGCDVANDTDCTTPSCPVGPVSIEQIQNPDAYDHVPEGCPVQIQGAVMTTPVFLAGPANAFYIQTPNSSLWSGIYIFVRDLDVSALGLGDVVNLAGTYEEYYTRSEIVVSSISKTGSAPVPQPIVVTPEQINDQGSDAEAYEGMLVQVQNVLTTATPFPREDGTDAGDFLVASSESPALALIVGRQTGYGFSCPASQLGISCSFDQRMTGQHFDFITGVVDFSWSHYRLEPRSDGDVGLTGDDPSFREQLHDQMVAGHVGLGYDNARQVMFSTIDNVDGQVECVYTGEWVATTGIPPVTVMNTEHTWAQSWGADYYPARSDLHHLFPTLSEANSRRGNNYFGEVIYAYWTQGGSSLGTDAAYSTVFEPRDQHKGDVARALFYFSLRYEMPIPDSQEQVIKIWNAIDPPDERESARNDAIEAVQGNRNPFVDHPEYADRISDF